ncbi:MAG: gliding motility-associated C-terminal domain-containing protein [Saprospiraceae bacterium]|nr:gliding motility-associated C-terminal domain-containing protein [Saprospiraceae bacterium]
MRLITTFIFTCISIFAFSQECGFLPTDTLVCGFKHSFPIDQNEGTFYFECENDKLISIASVQAGETEFIFSECGEYEIIFVSNIDGCVDSLTILVDDNSNSITSITTNIGLGYGDIDCPEDVLADCDADGVSISLPNGTPVPIWSFCSTVSCSSTQYTTEIIGTVEGCLADSIVCDTVIIGSSNEECIDTNQFAFILLNSDGDMVDNNSFLEYLASLQSSLGLECNLINDGCNYGNNETCYDTTIIDTTFLPIPVRIGGKWTLANIDTIELFDTTYFEFMDQYYELILDPGVEYYGPGNLDVYLSEIEISSSNDTTRNFPYGFELVLEWEEDWIIDTLELIKEIPIDTTGDCFACGGNFFNSGFNVPGIPDFPCGPVSISYPDACECDMQFPDYSFQFISCEPKEWQFDILGGDFEIIGVSTSSHTLLGNSSVIITLPESQIVEFVLEDNNACISTVSVDLISIIEFVEIYPVGNHSLSCEESTVTLEVVGWSMLGMPEDFHVEPVWYLPDGSTSTGLSIDATESGTYTVEYTDELGCIMTDIFSIQYDDTIETITEELEICGDTYEYLGIDISGAGNYIIEQDCNTIINLTVVAHSYEESYETYFVCEGESVEVEGQVFPTGFHVVEVDNGTYCPDIINVEVIGTLQNVSYNLSQICDENALLEIVHDENGAEYEIIGSGGFNSSFTGTGNSYGVELDQSGIYEVNVTSNGCSVNFSVDVHLMEYTILPSSDVLLTCENTCTTLIPTILNERGATNPSDYEVVWTGPNGFTSADEVIEICETGSYTIQLVYGNGCSTESTVGVEEQLEPEVQVIVADLCYGECYDDGIYTFCQTTQATIDIDECTQLEVDITISEEVISERVFSLCQGESILVGSEMFDQEGDYSVVLPSVSGCDSTLLFSVDILERGVVGSDHMIDCLHEEALLQYVSNNNSETYIWKDENGVIVGFEQEYLATKPGVYQLEVTVEGEDHICVFIEEYELLNEVVVPEIILNDAYILNCEEMTNIQFDTEEGTEWEWTGGPDDIAIENSALQTSQPGDYMVVVTNKEGCTNSRSIVVDKIDPIQTFYITEPTCEGESNGRFELSKIQGGMAPFTLFIDGEEMNGSVEEMVAGEYILTIIQSDGCVFEEVVTVEEIPDLDEIPLQELTFCTSQGITIKLNITDQITYEWLDGFESLERTITKEGLYEIELSNGCSSIVSSYNVDDTRVAENFVVSNIFSPDGNSTNERMKVAPQVDYQDFLLRVFSRNGSLVYKTSNLEEGWDGKIGGNNALLGSYVWMIEAEVVDCNGEIESVHQVGTVMVIY